MKKMKIKEKKFFVENRKKQITKNVELFENINGKFEKIILKLNLKGLL